ncbi:hypothetical protein F5876DRAFT_63510 [Lentinula aff. lateritia]|uniref:Uncharacterized protein n=1 Tax=Lentinula aff. lateritia TaxID=2804960 RepID=A0ACC1U7G7_9AGAR|nr:hypothetical protein F5876DRAFT_63510 [Lentinula aff. lateritia]
MPKTSIASEKARHSFCEPALGRYVRAQDRLHLHLQDSKRQQASWGSDEHFTECCRRCDGKWKGEEKGKYLEFMICQFYQATLSVSLSVYLPSFLPIIAIQSFIAIALCLQVKSMRKYDFLAWLIRQNPSLSTLNFTETQFKVQQVKWNRHRRHVPYTIYNGVIFDWVVGNIFPTEWPFEDNEEDKDVFCLELSSVIGSPEFLHHLLQKANDFLPSDAAVPPFGLGFLLSYECKYRGELGPSDLLDMLLGDLMFRRPGDKGAGHSAAVKDLYRDWITFMRQRQEHELNLKDPVEVDITDVRVNLNRKRLESSSDPAFDDDWDSDSSSKSKPPYKRLRRSPSSPPPTVKPRSGLLHWLSSTTTRFKPDVSLNVHNNKSKEKGSPGHTNEDQSSDPDSSSILFKLLALHQAILEASQCKAYWNKTSGPDLLRLICFQKFLYFRHFIFHLSEEGKTLCVKNGPSVDSSYTVSSTSTSKSSPSPSLVVTPTNEVSASVEQGSDSLNNPQAQFGDNSNIKSNKSANEALDIAEVDALLLSSSNLSCSTAEVIRNGEESLDAAEVDVLLMTFNTTAASNSFDRLSLTSTQASWQSVNTPNTSTHLSFFTASPSTSSLSLSPVFSSPPS